MAREIKNVTSWCDAFRILCDLKYNNGVDSIIVPANNLRSPKNHHYFDSSLLSLRQGADYVFRDENTQDTLQVRVYSDGNVEPANRKYDQEVYHIQLDEHNPSKGVDEAIQHLFEDVIGVKFNPNILN